MTIPINEYVSITSGVGGVAQVAQRELIGRIFSTNALIPPQQILFFRSLTSVGNYFGTTSEEYLRAALYFSYISKVITIPEAISFSRWVNVAQAPLIYGAELTATLLELQGITAGALTITIGGVVGTITGLNFSALASFTAIAAELQTVIRAAGSGTQFTAATVSYNAIAGAFDFVGGNAVTAVISVTAGIPADISALIGWTPNDASAAVPTPPIWCNGSAVETLTQTLTNSINASNNFGSFCFTSAATLTLTDVQEICAWNAAPDQNNLYMYSIPVTVSNAATWSAALAPSAVGSGLTLDPAIAGQYPEELPMAILAATNYDAQNASTNYMFQQLGGLTPSVTDLADKLTYDALQINYYGQTQQSGQNISFYQEGVLLGPSTAAKSMNTYANEQWLKDAIAVQLLNLLLGLNKVSANQQGRGQILAAIQNVISLAQYNGTISPGKTLTYTQQAYITSITGDAQAWQQVQTNGFWLDVTTTPEDSTATYLLVYSKDDVIRFIEGTDALI